MMSVVTTVLAVAALMLGFRLWRFLNREDAKYEAQHAGEQVKEELEQAKQHAHAVYTERRAKLETAGQTEFLPLLDAAYFGADGAVLTEMRKFEELPLTVAHALQLVLEAKRELHQVSEEAESR